MDIIDRLETKAAHLARCVESIKAGTCPLHVAAAAQAPARRAPKRAKKAKRTKPQRGAVVVVSATKPPDPEPKVEPSRPGARDAAVLKAIAAHPGLTLTELAHREAVPVGTMFSLLRRLTRDKRCVKANGGYHPPTTDAEN